MSRIEEIDGNVHQVLRVLGSEPESHLGWQLIGTLSALESRRDTTLETALSV
jgi:hypothetical protein